MKKWIIIIFLISINLFTVQAINLEVSSRPISNSYIIELGEPAVYELTIKNLGENDNFEIYSLVGLDITHNPISITTNQTKRIQISIIPQDSLTLNQISPFAFEYKIKDSKNEIQKETLSINIVKLASAFLITSEPINPDSETILLNIKNNLIYDFSGITIRATSAFFDHEEIFSLTPNGMKDIVVSINRDNLKILSAGTYLMDSQITVNGKTAYIESLVRFLEQEGIERLESESGTLIRRGEIIIRNTGNLEKTVEVITEKNLLSYLFTTTNIPPTNTEINGLTRTYSWRKKLIPGDELKVVIKTNWFFPIIILIIILTAIVLIRKSIYANLELVKKITFVKTKGGQFALKITVRAKAKKYIEKITIVDKLPRLVKLYNKFGIIPPDRIDLENRKLEWRLDSLNKDEIRVFTYIIYSEIGVVGRFELPEAKAIYEQNGNIKETTSNRSFYINETN